MFCVGLGYFSQHKTVAAIPSSKYLLHYYLPREKPKKEKDGKEGKKKEVAVSKQLVAMPVDLPARPVDLAASDSPDPVRLLEEFLHTKSDKKRLLLVEGMSALFGILRVLRHNKKRLAGVIVFDNPSNLFDYDIPILDAERIRDGVWWKRKAFLDSDIHRTLRDYESIKVKLKKIKKIRRKLVADPSSSKTKKAEAEAKANRPRGGLHSFITDLDALIGKTPRRDKILRSLIGYLAGVEKKSAYKKTVKYLTDDLEVDAGLLKSYKKFLYSPQGTDLFSVFYYHNKGDSFRALQSEFKHLSLDDWETLSEWVPPTEKYKFFTKPA